MNKTPLYIRLAGMAFITMMALSPISANAGSLNDAFQRLTGSSGGAFNTSSESSFRTSTRKGYTGGGASIRFSQKRYSLVRASAPSFNAGCHGIDLHLGGFSFINTDEITKMLNQVLNGALAVAFDMAITALCPPCAAAMEWAEGIARKAASMAVDTCEASRALVANTKQAIEDPKNIGQQAACSSIGMAAGKYTGWYESKREACDDDAAASLQDTINSSGNDGDKESNAGTVGNETWIALQAVGLAPKQGSSPNKELKPYAELILSWVGTSIAGASDATRNGRWPALIRNADDVMAIFMCGTGTSSGSYTGRVADLMDSADTFCESRIGAGGNTMEVYSCPDDDCQKMKPVTVDTKTGLGKGFLYIVIEELGKAIDNVANDQPLTDTQKGIISQAPFPLYRAINVAAISPDLAESIVMNHAQALSYMIGLEYLKDLFRQSSQSSVASELSPELMTAIYDSLSDLREQSFQVAEQLSILSETSQQIMGSVERINKAALASNLAQGITDSAFARSVGGS